MNWLKKNLADVAGTREPDYGPSAIQTVTEQCKATPYSELKAEDLAWKAMQSTCVETQTFYFNTEEGATCMAQVIYSNVMGVRTTCQFNSKIYDHDGPGQHQWCSDPLTSHKFSNSNLDFTADHVSVHLDSDAKSYTIKSDINSSCKVDLTISRTSPGFLAGTDGTSSYGTDPKHPWGRMRHAFWPRCTVTGSMTTPKKSYNLAGRGVFIMALQGMKPHHAAARWNFVNFQSPTYSAIQMEFTTPPSYGTTTVNVGCIATDDQILMAGSGSNVVSCKHLAASTDPVSSWPEPKALLCKWDDASKGVSAELMGDLGQRVDRVDVLAHVPGIIKNLIGGVVGTKPIIFQYVNSDQLTIEVTDKGEKKSEKGRLFMEATFIS